jgi:hypothetical protein
MADVQTSEVNAKLVPINVSHEMLYADRSSEDDKLLIRPFLQKKIANIALQMQLKF